MDIKKRLLKEADEKYKNFSSGLIPGCSSMLGVRLPVLRKMAKEIYKENKTDFLKTAPEFYEEKILQAMLIGLLKDEPENILKEVERFIEKIDNWAVCDTFCAGLKFAKKHKEKVWNFINIYAKSDKEFEIRFFLVMVLFHFVEEKYLKEIFSILNEIKLNGYYAKMGAAWLVSVCFVNFPKETKAFLLNNNLDSETQNKAIRKIVESYRVSNEDKIIVRGFKK